MGSVEESTNSINLAELVVLKLNN